MVKRGRPKGSTKKKDIQSHCKNCGEFLLDYQHKFCSRVCLQEFESSSHKGTGRVSRQKKGGRGFVYRFAEDG